MGSNGALREASKTSWSKGKVSHFGIHTLDKEIPRKLELDLQRD